ncbi:CHAT domain-containing protein [Fulvivirgaceae bacterium BMA10]|uniref:CHAT domain-containing protein n=1 Tax=Splendidivirga corallicola TaxID=3051826 RepID=A0ABT8KLZ5_9BACT|nr:CHAT domain-containing protein [Fulvivirgaceae bacterium BMA10]
MLRKDCNNRIINFGFYAVLLFLMITCQEKDTKTDDTSSTAERIDPMEIKEFDHPDLHLPDSLFELRILDSAIFHYQKVAEKFAHEKNWRGYVHTLNQIGASQIYSRKYKEALATLNESLERALEILGESALETMAANYYLGVCYDETGEPFKALEIHQKALLTRITTFGENNLLVAESYKAIGDVYLYNLKNFLKAKNFFDKSSHIREALIKESDVQLMIVYYSLSVCYRNLADYDNALFFGQQAMNICKRLPGDNTRRIAIFYNNLGNIFFLTDQNERAIKFYNSAIDLVTEKFGENDFYLADYYDNLGSAFKELGEEYQQTNTFIDKGQYFQKALFSYKKALSINEQHEYSDVSQSLFNLGWIYTSLNDFKKAKYYFDQCLEDRIDNGYENVRISYVYRDLGNLYKKFDSLEIALDYYQKALVEVLYDFNPKTNFDNPKITNENFNSEIFDFMLSKAKVLSELFRKKGVPKFLKGSLDCYLILDQINDITRNSFIHENSKLLLESYYETDFENALDISFQLHELYSENQFQEIFFKFLEKSKYIILFESMSKVKELGKLNVPDSIIQLNSNLISKMSYLYQQRNELTTQEEADQQKLKELNSEMVKITRQQEQLRSFLQNNYPEYYDIKYDSITPTLMQVQSNLIEDGTVILEYFWGTRDVYVLKIKKEEAEIIKITKTQELEEMVEKFSNLFSEGANFQNDEIFQSYKKLAHNLYSALMAPLISDELKQSGNQKKLVVIPDGPLSTISFDSFLLSPDQDSKIDYRGLDYLIRHFEVSYAYSINVAFQRKQMDPSGRHKEILAFSYDNFDNNNSGRHIGLKKFRNDKVSDLPGSSSEIWAISQLFEGDYFYGDLANESNFKSYAEDYQILHLALHGESDESDPYSSKLLFKNELDKNVEDGFLHTYELYNMDLGAEMTVLSACNSGKGKLQSGEGVLSLARAFTYAGCKSLITSLWQVSDDIAPEIMYSFYKNLGSGQRKGEALQKAKLQYLEKADHITSSPYYWSSFVVMGDTSSVELKGKGNFWKWVIPISLLSVLLGWLAFRKNGISSKISQ